MQQEPDTVATSHTQVAYRLALIRNAHNLTQTELSRLMGWVGPRYSQWETGRCSPAWREAIQLCDAFGVTLEWIYRGDATGMRTDVRERIAAVQRRFEELAMIRGVRLPPVVMKRLKAKAQAGASARAVALE